MFDAEPSQPDVEIDVIIWLNLRRMTLRLILVIWFYCALLFMPMAGSTASDPTIKGILKPDEGGTT